MALPVEWRDADLSDFIPSTITALADVLPSIKQFLQVEAELKKVQVKLQSATVPTIDPIYAVMEQVVAQVTTLIDSIENSQVCILNIPPLAGGNIGTQRFLRAALQNTRDSQRPDISLTGYVAGFGVIAPGPDFTTVLNLSATLQGAFLSDPNIARQAGVEQFASSGQFASPVEANRIAGTAAPIPESPWVSLKVTQLIPGVGSILDNLKGFLAAIVAQKPENPIDGFVDFVDESIAQTAATIDKITELITTLTTAFAPTPIKLFSFAPAEGGTQAVIDSLSSWFDSTEHEEIADITNNTAITGQVVIFGGDQATVSTIYGIFSTLFGV